MNAGVLVGRNLVHLGSSEEDTELGQSERGERGLQGKGG
jgi:hypothetical protein